MLLSKAIEGFILSKQIEGLADSSLLVYQRYLERLCIYLQNPEIEQVSSDNIKQFIYYLQTDYKPQRWNSEDISPLSDHTLKNVWITLKSFYTWGQDELNLPDVMKNISCPKVGTDQPDPFTQKEVKSILQATKGERLSQIRNYAIILTLLDTGIRVSELCLLSMCDYSPKTGRIEIRFGKGNKKRFVHLGATTRKALWKYLTKREQDSASPLFAKLQGKQLTARNLEKLLERIGAKAQVQNVYPHRFRHTFAIEYIRNGGDIFTLQMLLGHSSLEMVRRYAKIATIDTERVHKRAGPVDNWL